MTVVASCDSCGLWMFMGKWCALELSWSSCENRAKSLRAERSHRTVSLLDLGNPAKQNTNSRTWIAISIHIHTVCMWGVHIRWYKGCQFVWPWAAMTWKKGIIPSPFTLIIYFSLSLSLCAALAGRCLLYGRGGAEKVEYNNNYT